jgi:hypothetical protein
MPAKNWPLSLAASQTLGQFMPFANLTDWRFAAFSRIESMSADFIDFSCVLTAVSSVLVFLRTYAVECVPRVETTKMHQLAVPHLRSAPTVWTLIVQGVVLGPRLLYYS